MSTLDAVGNIHDSLGKFAGHVKGEADPDTLAPPSAARSGRWREREWNEAEFTCPACGRDIGDDYHEWDSEDGTHTICQPIDGYLTDEGLIREDDFDDLFGVQRKPSGDLFELEDLAGVPENRIWTIVDSGTGDLYASPGLHTVNRLGYITTERPWDDDIPDAEWSISSGADECDCGRQINMGGFHPGVCCSCEGCDDIDCGTLDDSHTCANCGNEGAFFHDDVPNGPVCRDCFTWAREEDDDDKLTCDRCGTTENVEWDEVLGLDVCPECADPDDDEDEL